MEQIIINSKGTLLFTSSKANSRPSVLGTIRIDLSNYGNCAGKLSESYLHDVWKSSIKTGWKLLNNEGDLIYEGNGFVSYLDSGFTANRKYCIIEIHGNLPESWK